MKERKLEPLQERLKNITKNTTELEDRVKQEVIKISF